MSNLISESEEPQQYYHCDFCGQSSFLKVFRVVIAEGYNKITSRPLWACADCSREKDRLREA